MNFDINEIVIAVYTLILSLGICFLSISFIFSKFDFSDTYWLCTVRDKMKCNVMGSWVYIG